MRHNYGSYKRKEVNPARHIQPNGADASTYDTGLGQLAPFSYSCLYVLALGNGQRDSGGTILHVASSTDLATGGF